MHIDRQGVYEVVASHEVTVATTQFACANDKASNLDKAESMLRRAAAEGAEIGAGPGLTRLARQD